MDGSGIVPVGQTQVPFAAHTKGSDSGSWSTSARQQTLPGCVFGHPIEPPPPPEPTLPPVANPPEPTWSDVSSFAAGGPCHCLMWLDS